MKRFLILLAAAFCLTGCCWFGHNEKDTQVLLVYFSSNNNLSEEAVGDFNDLKSSWLPGPKETDKIVLVYHHFMDQTPVLERLYKDRSGNTVEDVIKEYPFSTNSADAATLTTVLADAAAAWPADRLSLVLSSHASGFLPAGYYNDPKEVIPGRLREAVQVDPYADLVKAGSVKSFAEDHGYEMELSALRQALSRYRFSFILFDCCLMANIEVAYELRGLCDYLLFSPTEILSDGFPYESIAEPVFSMEPVEALTTIAQKYMAYYRAYSGVYRSATITLVETSALEAVATACRPIFQATQEQIMTLDRSQVQAYFRYGKHWYYDLDDFVGRLADSNQYRTFTSALQKAVIFKDTTEEFIGLPITHYSGLSIYIPRPEYTVLNNYYKTLAWNKATGLVP